MKKIFIFIVLISATFQLKSQATIQGVVKEKDNGKSIPGVAVYVHELQKGTVTDAGGRYVLKGLPRGHFQLHFSMIGYGTVHKEIEIKGKESIELNVEMEPKEIVTQEVVISAAGFGMQHDNAIKVDILKPDELKTNLAPGAMQKLASIPGVDIISRGNGVGSPVIRGLSLTNILGLNNNVRIENFQFSPDHPYLIDDFGVERVEVIKGPASILYGANAIGGVINFIREVPAPVGTVKGDVHLNYHGNGNGIVGNVGVKGTRDHFFWGIRTGFQSFSDYKQATGEYVPNSRFSRQNVQLMGGVNAKNSTHKIYYDYMHFTPAMVVPPAKYGTGIQENPSRKLDDWYQDLNYNLLSSRNSFFLNNNKLELNFSYQNNLRRLEAAGTEKVHMFLQSFGYEAKNTFTFDKTLSITGGIQGNYSFNRNGEAPEHVLPDYSESQISAFVFGQYKPLKYITLQTGLRYNHDEIDADAAEGKVKRGYNNLNFTIGGTGNISKSLMLRANFAKGYRPPSIAELTQYGAHGNRAEFGDPKLDIQQNYEFDLSLHYHISNLVIDVAGYYNSIRGYIFLQEQDSLWQGLQAYKYVQSNAILKGIELGFRYLPMKNMEISGNYALVDARKSNGDNLPLIPQNKLKLRVESKRLFSVKNLFDAGLASDIVYAFKKINIAPEEQSASDYFVWNISADFRIPALSNKFSMGIFLNNILNTKYIDFLSQLRPQGYFEPGRYVSVKTSYNF